MKKVTGIGGIFFKCQNAEQQKAWYEKHLGIPASKYGTSFAWRDADDPAKQGMTQWSTFPDNTSYFQPSQKEFMINYRVENLEALVAELKRDGVEFCDEMETYDYGKFIHLMDPEGNKIELWEPIDAPAEDAATEGGT